jgi:hypothetical protein
MKWLYIGDQDENWASHSRCSSRYLVCWLTGTYQSLPFAVLLVWREQKDHLTDCYRCLTKIAGHNSKSKHTIIYPNIPSALRPVEHDDSLPNLKPPLQRALHEEEPTSNALEDEPGPSCTNIDPDFPELSVCHLISQSELNDLVRDISLSKIRAEFLASRLQEWNLLQQGVKVSYKKRQQALTSLFSKDGKLVYCNDV